MICHQYYRPLIITFQKFMISFIVSYPKISHVTATYSHEIKILNAYWYIQQHSTWPLQEPSGSLQTAFKENQLPNYSCTKWEILTLNIRRIFLPYDGVSNSKMSWTKWKLQTCIDHVRFEIFTAVTMKNGVFWVVTPCGSCKNRRSCLTWYFFAAYVGC
jgi:hypothetical protein